MDAHLQLCQVANRNKMIRKHKKKDLKRKMKQTNSVVARGKGFKLLFLKGNQIHIHMGEY